jgi:hypothetical protein
MIYKIFFHFLHGGDLHASIFLFLTGTLFHGIQQHLVLVLFLAGIPGSLPAYKPQVQEHCHPVWQHILLRMGRSPFHIYPARYHLPRLLHSSATGQTGTKSKASTLVVPVSMHEPGVAFLFQVQQLLCR